MSDPLNLAEAYPVEQQRIRDLLEQYAEVEENARQNPNGPRVFTGFAVAAIKAVQQRADKAAAEHDTVAMLRAYEEMRGCR